MKSIDMPPFAPTLMESTRAIGYSLEAAVADIIDNSIAAEASNIDIFYLDHKGAPYIAIIDNGIGMDGEQLSTAMRYGSRSPSDVRSETDLGRFGLGLKTASLSQCRVLTVASKRHDDLEVRRWDLDHVRETEQWSLLVLSEKEWRDLPHIDSLLQYDSGTLVIWQDLDRLMNVETDYYTSILGKKMDVVREHISLVFHRFLEHDSKGIGKRITIRMNNDAVEPADPFIKNKSSRPMADETITLDGHDVIVRPYILPHISKMNKQEIDALGGKDGLRKRQGFYVYRNRRLIVWGTWFRMMRKEELSKLARIQVDIPNSLDEMWALDIKKSEAIPPAAVRQSLSAVIENLAGRSKRTWMYRGKKEIDPNSVKLWDRIETRDGGICYQINREHPVIAKLLSSCPKNALEATLRHIELSLPLNQLFIDLENDASIDNDKEVPVHEVENVLNQILADCVEVSAHNAMLDALKFTEPFMRFPEMLDEKKIKGAGLK